MYLFNEFLEWKQKLYIAWYLQHWKQRVPNWCTFSKISVSSSYITIHPVPRFRSFHKAIMGMAQCQKIFVCSANCPCSLSIFGLGGESSCRMFTILLTVCQLSGDSTIQSSPQCVTVHPVPKFRSCHNAIMVTTGRAHCYTLILYKCI